MTDAGRRAHAELLRALTPPPVAIITVTLAIPLFALCAALWWVAL